MCRFTPQLLFLALSIVLSASAVLAQQCDIIYVTPNGATSGAAGTKDNPAEINYAVTLMTPSIRKINLAVGIYDLENAFPLVDNVTFEGGFDPSLSWAKVTSPRSIIIRDSVGIQSSPNRVTCIEADGIDNWRIQDVDIIMTDAPDVINTSTFGVTGVTNYGVYINDCSNFSLVRTSIVAGNGGNGQTGPDGANGTNGAAGTIGGQGDENGTNNTGGGGGGNGWSGGMQAGGAGGAGGEGDNNVSLSIFPPSLSFTSECDPNATSGLAGSGTNAGTFGTPGACNTSFFSAGCDNQAGFNGTNGTDGQSGTDGVDGVDGSPTHSGGFFQPGDGLNGSGGTPGSGGGGGGGGGGYANFIALSFPNFADLVGGGGGGGGGGEGGQAGAGGRGGGGGGGSFGIYVNNAGTGGQFVDLEVTSAFPGNGANGGFGGVGGNGGNGGPGGATGAQAQPGACDIGSGGDGGDGGDGGNGGDGGDGVGGFAAAVYFSPGSMVDTLNFKAPVEPFLTARSVGCTDRNVRFDISSSGNITWFFGGTATPVTANGSSPVVQYTSQGRKTVTVIANGQTFTFTDFLDIRDDGSAFASEIVSTDDTICAGEVPTFASSFTGADAYIWDFGGAAPNPADSSQATIDTTTFNTPGDYFIVLQTLSACCGLTDPDTFAIHVRPNPAPVVELSTISNPTATICEGEDLQFEASIANVGADAEYLWRINGVIDVANSGIGLPIYTATGLQDGDNVSLRVVSTSVCTDGDTLAATPSFNVIVNAVPQFPSPSVTGCVSVNPAVASPGEPVEISVINPPTDPNVIVTWDLGNGSTSLANPDTVVFTTPGKYAIQAFLWDTVSGCVSTQNLSACGDSVEIVFFPQADLAPNVFSGCVPLTVNFDNLSENALSYSWDFGDGSPVSTDVNPQHTYLSPGIYDVQLIAFGSQGSDTLNTVSVKVHPKPVADISASPTIVIEPNQAVKFTSNSTFSDSWSWNFGDPASSSNTSNLPSPTHVYADQGTYTVQLIVSSPFGCSDTIVKDDFILVDTTLGGLTSVAENLTDLSTVQVYPNPFEQNLTLEVNSLVSANAVISITDLSGREVYVRNTRLLVGEQRISLDPEGLAAGVYMLRLTTANDQLTFKLIRR